MLSLVLIAVILSGVFLGGVVNFVRQWNTSSSDYVYLQTAPDGNQPTNIPTTIITSTPTITSAQTSTANKHTSVALKVVYTLYTHLVCTS